MIGAKQRPAAARTADRANRRFPLGSYPRTVRRQRHAAESTATLIDRHGIAFTAGWIDVAERIVACAAYDPDAALEMVRAGRLRGSDMPTADMADALAAALALAGRDDVPSDPTARAALIADVARAAFQREFVRPDGTNDLERIMLLECGAVSIGRYAHMCRGAARIAASVRQRAREALEFASESLRGDWRAMLAAGEAAEPAATGGAR